MAIEKGKPDLLTVLNRRKQTVAAFLNQANVVDLASLQTLIKSLESSWSLSNEFMREANAHALKKYSLEASKKVEPVLPVKEVELVEESDDEEKSKASSGKKKGRKPATESGE